MKNTSLKLIIIPLVISLFFSCDGKKLSRSKAEKLVVAFYEYPNVEVYNFVPGGVRPNDVRKYRDLTEAGLISFQKAYSLYGDFNILFTSKGNEYVTGTQKGLFNVTQKSVVSNIRNFGEVTGIQFSDEERRAKVTFTTIRSDITPFGRFKGYAEGETVEYSASMVLFDDGWRIEDKSVQNFKPSQFSFFGIKAGSQDENISNDNLPSNSASRAVPQNSADVIPGTYPEVSMRRLGNRDINSSLYSEKELRIMRNEIFARHGYRFKSADLQNHFGSKSWYTPRFDNVDHLVTNIEKANIKLIQHWEKMHRQAN